MTDDQSHILRKVFVESESESENEESCCSAGEFVEEATPSTRSLCEAGERFTQKGPVPHFLDVS